jgi:hypothetical protein
MINKIVRRVLTLIFFAISCLPSTATRHYISTIGNDQTGDGTTGKPWKTLYKACSSVTTAGDTIYVRAGTYSETVTSKLAPGVSLIGEGVTSIITSATLKAEWTPVIDMRSSSVVDGKQSISNLKFDGNSLNAAQAIWIAKRNNVKIHHCTFVDFHYIGVLWTGDGGYAGDDPYLNAVPPTTYVVGSEFHDNIVTNCSYFDSYGRGALFIGGHDGMLIYNNVITQTQRAMGSNGYPIKAFANGGWMKGMKLYNNVLTKVYDGYGSWVFAFESAFLSGCEIYNNTLTGAIDINFMEKGSYSYGVYIHDNTLGPDAPSAADFTGIILEFGIEDVIIERNHFRNCAVGIHHTMRYPKPWVKNVKVRYNLFENLGENDAAHYHSALRFGETENTFDIENYEIYNNIFHGNPSVTPYFGIHMRGFNTATNIKILNNIFLNFGYYWFESNRGDYFTNLYVQNNILYNNANSNGIDLSGTPTNYVNSGNKTVNPGFYSSTNFHPNTTSPVKDAGLLIPGETLYDLDGVLVDNTPNIGCYETAANYSTPKYLSSVIENNKPKLMIVRFDISLANIVPDKSCFTVNVNSESKAISKDSVGGGYLYLVLANAVKSGDQVTLTYVAPSSSPLQSVNNVPCSGFENVLVTNNVKPAGYESTTTYGIGPVPIHDNFNILITGDTPDSEVILKIYSLSGSLEYERYFEPGSLSSSTHISDINFNPGLYLAEFYSDGQIVAVIKIIVAK